MTPDPPDPLDLDLPPCPRPRPDADGVSPELFRASFGEDLHQLLDLTTWRTARDLSAEYARMQADVDAAVEREGRVQRRVRAELFPRLAAAPGAPRGAGVYQVSADDIRLVHDGPLFRGGVEC